MTIPRNWGITKKNNIIIAGYSAVTTTKKTQGETKRTNVKSKEWIRERERERKKKTTKLAYNFFFFLLFSTTHYLYNYTKTSIKLHTDTYTYSVDRTFGSFLNSVVFGFASSSWCGSPSS